MAGGGGGTSNLIRNLVIAVLVPVPSILFYASFVRRPGGATDDNNLISAWCAAHPLLLANVLFFLNVDVLLWLVGLLLSNHWLIDLYWTVIPVLLLHYYRGHPASDADPVRSAVTVALTWAWSARLTHNYLRRERWELGAREDWRFHEMRGRYGGNWWWMSFFAVYLSQQAFLIGVCLPMYAVHSTSSDDRPWGVWDLVAASTCVTGIVTAHFADTQLHRFVAVTSSSRNDEEKKKPLVLKDGLWRYSRHPNYVGEQLWWWGMYLFAWNLGQRWMFVGPLVNTLCLAYVTVLVERRMLKQERRAEAYRLYQKSTSVWIPFPWFRKQQAVVVPAKEKET